MGQLGFVGEHLSAHRGAVAPVDRPADVGQRGVLRRRARMEEPGLVDRPEFVRRDEPAQARERRDVFVVALFSRGTAGRAVPAAEPVGRRAPAVRARHLDSVPQWGAGRIAGEGRHRVHHGVGPVQLGEDAAVGGPYRLRWPSVAAVGPDEHRRVRTQHLDLGAQTLPRHAPVLVVPLLPLLPLVAAHPAIHQRDSQLVGHLNEPGRGDLGLQPQHVQTEIADVVQHGGVAFGVVAEKQIGGIGSAPHGEITAVDLEEEIPAGARYRAAGGIASPRDGADAESLGGRAGDRPVLHEVEFEVVEIRAPERVGPPQVRVVDLKGTEILRGESDVTLLTGLQTQRLGDTDHRPAGPGDGRLQDTAHHGAGVVAHGGMQRQLGTGGIRERQLRGDRRWSDVHRPARPQTDRLEDPGVAVGHEGDRSPASNRVGGRSVSEIAPVDPVVPAVGQFHPVNVLNGALGSHPDREGVQRARTDPPRHVQIVIDVHPDDLAVVGDPLAVEPDVGAVVDSGEIQPVRREPGGSRKRGAIPPVLLVELGDALHVRAVVQVGVDPG